MTTVVTPPRQVFGTHSLAILSDPVAHGQQVWNTSASINAAVPPTSSNFVPGAPEYTFGTHSLAILQTHAGQSSHVFPPSIIPGFQGFSLSRDFVIAEAEMPMPTASWILNTSALISGGVPGTNPLVPYITTVQQYPLDVPFSDVYAPAPPPFVPVVTIFLVQATAIGWSIDPFTGTLILRAPGDVFYVAVVDFADSSIDYLAGQPGSPFFGWMKVVPPGTPLTNPTHYGVPFYDFQPPPRRIVF